MAVLQPAVENTEAAVNFTLRVLLVQFSACQFACFSSVCFLCLCICCTSRSDVSFICGEKPLGSKISIFILNHYPAIRWHIWRTGGLWVPVLISSSVFFPHPSTLPSGPSRKLSLFLPGFAVFILVLSFEPHHPGTNKFWLCTFIGFNLKPQVAYPNATRVARHQPEGIWPSAVTMQSACHVNLDTLQRCVSFMAISKYLFI